MNKYLYQQFYQIESTHWWFVGRRSIILDQMEKYVDRFKKNHLLDIGFGAGIMLEHLKLFGIPDGMDASDHAVECCRQRYGNALHIRKGSLPNDIPYQDDSYDVVMLLDVLEHIDDDKASLNQIYRILDKDGYLFCTVPAHMSLWSGHDIINEHKRRYQLVELKQIMLDTGFHIEKISYYNCLLAPLVFLVRLCTPNQKRLIPKSDFKMYPKIINSFLTFVFSMEMFLLRYLNLPFGISIICIARKKG